MLAYTVVFSASILAFLLIVIISVIIRSGTVALLLATTPTTQIAHNLLIPYRPRWLISTFPLIIFNIGQPIGNPVHTDVVIPLPFLVSLLEIVHVLSLKLIALFGVPLTL